MRVGAYRYLLVRVLEVREPVCLLANFRPSETIVSKHRYCDMLISVYQSVCSFLVRSGTHVAGKSLFLGTILFPLTTLWPT